MPALFDRKGQMLLELIAAIALTATAIVPALRLVRDAMEQTREIEQQELLTTLCVSKMEEHLALASAAWTSTTATGNFSAEGYAALRYIVVRSDQPAQGGMADRLMSVTATVFEDENGNTAFDAGEPSVVMASKAANLARYLE
jgi:type II secretory pathway component PulJ